MNEIPKKLKEIEAKFLINKQAAIHDLVKLEASKNLTPDVRENFFKKNPLILKYFTKEYSKEKSAKSSEAMAIVSNVSEAKFYSLHPKINLNHIGKNGKLLSDEQIEEIKNHVKEKEGDNNFRLKKKAMNSQLPFGVLHVDKKNYAMYHGKKANKHLGAGGFGKVKLMQDLDSGEYFGAKIQNPKNGKFFANEELVRIQQEVDNLKKMDSFECFFMKEAVRDEENNIIEPAQAVIGMKLGKGHDWQSEIEVPMSMTRFLQQCRNFLYAIKAQVHDKGIIHVDIKPDNVLRDAMTDDFTVIDAGFGISKEDAAKNKYSKMGTPLYMAPEIIAAKTNEAQYSEASDVYAAGVSLAEKAGLFIHEYDVYLLKMTGQFPPEPQTLILQQKAWPIIINFNGTFYYYSVDRKGNFYGQALETTKPLKDLPFSQELKPMTISKRENSYIHKQITSHPEFKKKCFLGLPRARILEIKQTKGNRVLHDEGLRAVVLNQLKLMTHVDKNQRPAMEDCVAFFDNLLEMSPQVVAKTRRIALFDVNEYLRANPSQKAILIEALKKVDEVWALDVGNPSNIQDQKQFNELQRELEAADIRFSGRLFNAPGTKLEDAARGVIAKTQEEYHDKWVGFFLVNNGQARYISNNVVLAQVFGLIEAEINRLSKREDNKIVAERIQLLKTYKATLENNDTKLNFNELEESLKQLEKKMYSTGLFKSTGAENIHHLREGLKKQHKNYLDNDIEMLNTKNPKAQP